MTVPLIPPHARMPNPPRVFLGRAADAARLAERLADPVVVLEGPHGIGKTSLLAWTLRHHLPALDARTVAIPAPAGDLTTWLEAARGALAPLVDAPGAPPPAGLLDAWIVDVLRLAEAAAVGVVADDLDALDDAALLPLVHRVARHARASRWVFVRARPLPVLALLEQTVSLRGLDAPDVQALAAALGGSPLSDAVLRACAGSPLRVRQHILEARLSGAATAVIRDARQLLAVAHRPLPAQALSGLVAGLTPGHIEQIAASGAAEVVGEHVRLAERHRAAVLAATPLGALDAHRDALLGLPVDADPAALLERIRLSVARGRLDMLADQLAVALLPLIDAGRCASLWAILADTPDAGPALLSKIRLAITSRAHPDIARWLLALSAPEAPMARVAWARAQFYVGRRREALETMRALAPRLAPRSGRVDAICQLAEFERRVGDGARGRALIEALDSRDATPVEQMIHGCHLVNVRASDLDYVGAAEALEGLGARFAALTLAEQRACFVDWTTALLFMGRGAEILAATRTVFGPDALEVTRPTHALMVSANLLFTLGRDLRLPALTRVLEAGRAGRHVVDRVFELFSAVAACWTGRVREAELALLAPTAEPMLGHRAILGVELAIDRAEALPPQVETQTHSASALLLDLARRRHALRHAAEPPPPPPRPAGLDASRYLYAWWLVADALQAIRDGAPSEGLRAACLAAEIAEEHALRLIAVHARSLAADLALLAGDAATHQQQVTGLEALAHHARSPRVSAIAALHSALALPAGRGELARLARLGDVAPRVARRAQAALGSRARLDRVDVAVLGHCGLGARSRARWRNLPTEPWRPGWGAVDAARVLWALDGAPIQCGPRSHDPALIRALVQAGGAASKALIVETVWGDAYDPRIHDRRIYMAVSRLRQRLGDDPERPVLIETTEGGYAIGRTHPFVWFGGR